MAAEHSVTEPENIAIESLFVPCTRYRDSYLARAEDHSDDSVDYFPFIPCEVELTAHGAQEGVLANGDWDWTELWSFITEKFVWFSPEVFIAGTDDGRTIATLDDNGFDSVLEVVMEFDDTTSGVTVRDTFEIFVSSVAEARVECDRVFEYLSSAFGGGKMIFTSPRRLSLLRNSTLPMSGPVLSRFLSSQSHGARVFGLHAFDLDTDQCQALAAIEPTDDLVVEMYACRSTDDGASALLEGVRNSRGPSAFIDCKNIDGSLLLEALRGNTNVKKLKLDRSAVDGERPQLLMQALADNLGLVELCFLGHVLTDETLSSVGESLVTHPNLEKLDLRYTLPPPPENVDDDVDDDDDDDESTIVAIDFEQRKTSRTNALVDMLRSNKKITTIQLWRYEFDASVLDKEVYPRLKLNEYRVRFRAVKRIEGTLREPLLGRALDAVAHDASLLFLLFSGSTDIDWAALRRTRRSRKRVRYTK